MVEVMVCALVPFWSTQSVTVNTSGGQASSGPNRVNSQLLHFLVEYFNGTHSNDSVLYQIPQVSIISHK